MTEAGPTSNLSQPISTVDELVDLIRGGEKPPERWRIGTEHEKIGLHEADLSLVTYEGPQGIGALLDRIANTDEGWERVFEEDNVIALLKDGMSITSNPAANSSFRVRPCARFTRRARSSTRTWHS